jgi:hypothetical protein
MDCPSTATLPSGSVPTREKQRETEKEAYIAQQALAHFRPAIDANHHSTQ